jgi:hypothetical protein
MKRLFYDKLNIAGDPLLLRLKILSLVFSFWIYLNFKKRRKYSMNLRYGILYFFSFLKNILVLCNFLTFLLISFWKNVLKSLRRYIMIIILNNIKLGNILWKNAELCWRNESTRREKSIILSTLILLLRFSGRSVSVWIFKILKIMNWRLKIC